MASNVQLVRRQLAVDDGLGGFAAEIAAVRARLAPRERALSCAVFMSIAAGCLVLGRRRAGLRWIGLLALLPAAWLAVELLWVEPTRSARAIALQKVAIVSEPRADLEPVATVRPGVEVEVLGGGDGSFVRVRAADRSGYAARDGFAIVQ